MININYLRSGMTYTLNNNSIKNINKEKDRLLEYLKLAQGFKEAHEYAICKKNLKLEK